MLRRWGVVGQADRRSAAGGQAPRLAERQGDWLNARLESLEWDRRAFGRKQQRPSRRSGARKCTIRSLEGALTPRLEDSPQSRNTPIMTLVGDFIRREPSSMSHTAPSRASRLKSAGVLKLWVRKVRTIFEIRSARREDLSAARSLLTTYLDSERRPTTRDRARYVVERVEAADGRVVSESERALDRAG